MEVQANMTAGGCWPSHRANPGFSQPIRVETAACSGNSDGLASFCQNAEHDQITLFNIVYLWCDYKRRGRFRSPARCG